jgi:hypothetical protein
VNRSINIAAVREPTPVTKLNAIQSRNEFSVSEHIDSLAGIVNHKAGRFYRFWVNSQAIFVILYKLKGDWMTEVQQMKSRVEAAIRRLDPKAIPSATFYDTASDRLFVTIVKGPRKVSFDLRGRDFTNGDADKINRIIEQGVKRLQHTPIG